MNAKPDPNEWTIEQCRAWCDGHVPEPDYSGLVGEGVDAWRDAVRSEAAAMAVEVKATARPAYREVPSEAARDVAMRFDKSVVVIVAWDRGHNLIHTTTYGRSPQDKVAAAELGELLARAAGGDLAQRRDFEDFRFVPAAESRASIERLTRDAGLMRTLLDQIADGCIDNARAAARHVIRAVDANQAGDAIADGRGVDGRAQAGGHSK